MGLFDRFRGKERHAVAVKPTRSKQSSAEQRLAPEEDARQAREALHRNDLAQAIHHIALALQQEPTREPWLILLRQIIGQTPGGDVDALFPPNTIHRSPPQEAVRAWGHHAAGRINEGLRILAGVHRMIPEGSYMTAWGFEWLKKATPSDITQDTMIAVLTAYLTPLPEYDLQFEDQREPIRWLYEWCRHWMRGQDRLQSETWFALTVLERKAGELLRAVQTANETFQREGDWTSAVALASAQLSRGDWITALGVLRRAATLSNEMPSVMMELADLQVERGEYASAQTSYEKVLAREPGHPAATPGAEYCRYFITRDPVHWQKLTAMANDKQFAARAWKLLERDTPIVGMFPEPNDVCSGVLRQLIEDYRQGRIHVPPTGPMELPVPYLEAPSNLLAIRAQTKAWGWKVSPRMIAAKPTKPDPRKPLSDDIKMALWNYDAQGGAFPTVSQPSPEIQSAIAEIANHPWDWEKDFRRGLVLAERLGPDQLAGLLAVAVYPPALPQGRWSALTWVPRVQVSVCQTIAGFGRTAWDNTTRRRVLLDLLGGPPDWLTLATAVALGQIAASFPPAETEIAEALRRTQKALPPHGFDFVHSGLLHVMKNLPNASKSEQSRYEKQLAKLSA